MKLFGYQLPQMSSLILWGLLWEVVVRLEITFFIPALSDIFVTLMEISTTKVFLTALSDTGYAFLLGTVSAIVIGIPLGIMMGKNRLLDELLLPWVNIFLSAPLTALVPVLMVLFGFGLQAIVITTALFSIWIIVLNARTGVMQINRSLVEMAHSFGATPRDAFFQNLFLGGTSRNFGRS